MRDSENFHTITNFIFNETEHYFHLFLYLHALFLKNKCNHLTGYNRPTSWFGVFFFTSWSTPVDDPFTCPNSCESYVDL